MPNGACEPLTRSFDRGSRGRSAAGRRYAYIHEGAQHPVIRNGPVGCGSPAPRARRPASRRRRSCETQLCFHADEAFAPQVEVLPDTGAVHCEHVCQNIQALQVASTKNENAGVPVNGPDIQLLNTATSFIADLMNDAIFEEEGLITNECFIDSDSDDELEEHSSQIADTDIAVCETKDSVLDLIASDQPTDYEDVLSLVSLEPEERETELEALEYVSVALTLAKQAVQLGVDAQAALFEDVELERQAIAADKLLCNEEYKALEEEKRELDMERLAIGINVQQLELDKLEIDVERHALEMECEELGKHLEAIDEEFRKETCMIQFLRDALDSEARDLNVEKPTLDAEYSSLHAEKHAIDLVLMCEKHELQIEWESLDAVCREADAEQQPDVARRPEEKDTPEMVDEYPLITSIKETAAKLPVAQVESVLATESIAEPQQTEDLQPKRSRRKVIGGVHRPQAPNDKALAPPAADLHGSPKSAGRCSSKTALLTRLQLQGSSDVADVVPPLPRAPPSAPMAPAGPPRPMQGSASCSLRRQLSATRESFKTYRMDTDTPGEAPAAASKRMLSRPLSRANSTSSITDMYEALGSVEFHSLDCQDSDLLVSRPRPPSVGSLKPASTAAYGVSSSAACDGLVPSKSAGRPSMKGSRSLTQLHAPSAMELDLSDVGRRSIASCKGGLHMAQLASPAPASGRSRRKQGSVHAPFRGEFMESAPSSMMVRSNSMGALRATKNKQSAAGLLPALNVKNHGSLDIAEWNSCRIKPAHVWAGNTSAVF